MSRTRFAVLLSCALHLCLGVAFWIHNFSRPSSLLASHSPILAYRIGGTRSHKKNGASKKPRTTAPIAPTGPSPSESNSPSGPTSSGDAGLSSNFAHELRERIEAHLRYPLSLQRRGISGSVKAQVIINARDGTLFEATITESSGHSSLDELALEAIRASAPFPLPPAQDAGKLTWSIPIEFRLGSR